MTLPEWIGRHAQKHGERIAATYLDDDRSEVSWTYAELWQRASDVSRRLPRLDETDPRALLLFPPGIEFLSAFLGCQLAGWIPVPTCYPKTGRELPRLDSAATDCSPSAIVSDQATLSGLAPEKLCPQARDLPVVATDLDAGAMCDPIDPESVSIDPNSLALLQYTSGSTSEPKGVMVRHRNLMANLEAIRRGFRIDWQATEIETPDCGVFWLPFFHDMGLIGGILEPLYVGGRTVLMSPRAFLQRPLRWLRAISDYQAVISGAPNFAYQLCVDRITSDQFDELDLGRWRIAFSGAEPIHAKTLREFASKFAGQGFSLSSFYPCYGLAEATLLAAGGDGPGEPRSLSVDRSSLGAGRPEIVTADRAGSQSLVSCGNAAHQTDLRVVDPETHRPVQPRVVGEIWLRGASITDGYWNRDAENRDRFHASLAGGDLSGGDDGYCRTGDLGFLHDGELYVTGRITDVIILRGRNLFPQDIEATVRATIGREGGQCAAVAVEGPRGEALAIVAELPRRADEASYPELVREIRRAVIEHHEVDPKTVLLVRQATVPLTSSGKVQRVRCRQSLEDGLIRSKYRYDRSAPGEQVAIPLPDLDDAGDRYAKNVAVETWMTSWLVARAGVEPGDVDLEKPFADYGLDSMTAVEMSGEIEDWSGIQLTPIVAWNYPTVAQLSAYIVDQISSDQVAADRPEAQASENDQDLERLLDEIEHLSDDEIKHELAEKRRP